MAFIPVTDIAKLVIHFSDNAGNEAINRIFVRSASGIPDSDKLDEMIDVVETWLGSDWAPQAASVWNANRITALDMTQDNSFYVDRTISVQGTSLDAPAPSEVTIAMSLRTGRAGRSNRGRLYHVGLGDTAFTGDYMSPVNIAALVNAYESLRSDFIAATFDWVVVSFQEDGVVKTQGTYQEITSIVVTDNIVDSMRSRKPRA